MEKLDCDVCKHFARKRGIVDPCDINYCDKPDLLPANIDAFRVWPFVRKQLIMAGFGEPIAINYTTALMVMDRLEIMNQLKVLSQLDVMFETMLELIKDKKGDD